ncbi:MAG: ABC transporter transmembrane domain-containing protein, partial [Lachnospiraceae bacterium]|nr:ABC transporter transmembrane domain-containing protein [Lachnospiraceae bacterium]
MRNPEQKSKERGTDRPGLFGINYIMPFIRPYGRKTIVMLFLGFLSSLADTVFPLFNRYALNHFIPEQSLRGFPVFILLYVILLALQTVTNYVSFYMCFDIEASIARDMRNSAFDHIQTLSFGYFNHNSVGYVLARTMSDTSKIGEMVSWKLMILMWSSSYFVCAAAVMLMIRPGLALAVLLLVPPTALLIRFFTGRLVRLNRRIREQNAMITGGYNEGVAGAAQVRSLAIEDVRIWEFHEDTAHMRKLSVRSAHYSALFTSIVTLMSSAALSMVLWRGGLLSMQGLMRIGTLSVFMSYA